MNNSVSKISSQDKRASDWLFFFLFYLLAYFPMLFTRFIIWDDITVYYDRIIQHENGYGYIIWLYYLLAEIDPNRIFVPTLLFLYFFACTVCLFSVLRKTNLFTKYESLLISFFCSVSPLLITRWSLATPYNASILPFLAGLCLFLDVMRVNSLPKRILSIGLLLFCLMNPVFSAPYGVFVFFYVIHAERSQFIGTLLNKAKEISFSLMKRVDFLLLPFVALAIKKTFSPSYGSRAFYNNIPSDIATLAKGFYTAFFVSIPQFLSDLVLIIRYDGSKTMFLGMLFGILLFLWIRRLPYFRRTRTFWGLNAICFFLMMGLSAYAHATVGKLMGYYLTDSRSHFALYLFFGAFVFSVVSFFAVSKNLHDILLATIGGIFMATTFSMQLASVRQGHVEYALNQILSEQRDAQLFVENNAPLFATPQKSYAVKVDYRFKFPIFNNFADFTGGFWEKRPYSTGIITYDNPSLIQWYLDKDLVNCATMDFYTFIPTKTPPFLLSRQKGIPRYLYADWFWTFKMMYLFDFDRSRYYEEVRNVGRIVPSPENKAGVCG